MSDAFISISDQPDSGWTCYAFGGDKDWAPFAWRAPIGKVPSAFVRLMMRVCLGCKWVKDGNEMIETERLKHDLDAFREMCRELMCSLKESQAMLADEWLESAPILKRNRAAIGKAARMLKNERTVGE